MLIVVYGHIGVGKSTLARKISEGLNAVLVRFEDVAPNVAEAVIQEAQMDGPITEQVYHAMHDAARHSLQQSRHVVLDGLYPQHARDLAVQIGHGAGASVVLVEVVCDRDVIKRRLQLHGDAEFEPEDYLQHQPEGGEEHRKHMRVNTTHVTPAQCAHEALTAIPDYFLLPDEEL